MTIDVLSKVVDWMTTDPAAVVGLMHAAALMLLAASPIAAVVVVGYSMSSHAKINEKTGIPDAQIRAAHSMLTAVGLPFEISFQ